MAVFLSLVLAGAVLFYCVARLRSAWREVRMVRIARDPSKRRGGHPELHTARANLLAALGWLDTGWWLLLWEALGARNRDRRQLELLHGVEAIGLARQAARRGGLKIPYVDVPTLCDPVTEPRLRGWWPVSTLLERLPRRVKGLYAFLKLRRPIARARAHAVELLEQVEQKMAGAPTLRLTRSIPWRQGMLDVGTARHLLTSAGGEVALAHQRVWWELLGDNDGGERRASHLLLATEQVERARILADRARQSLGLELEVPAPLDLVDPVVDFALKGHWVGWALLVLAPSPLARVFRSWRLDSALRSVRLELYQAEKALLQAVVEREQPSSLLMAAK